MVSLIFSHRVQLAAFLSAAFTLIAGASVSAATLTIAPERATVSVGEEVVVNIVVSGLDVGYGSALAAFDGDLLFDPTVLAYTDIAFGDELDVLWEDSIRWSDASWPGVASMYEVSYDDPGYIELFQPASFVLATVRFEALSVGVSTLDFFLYALLDAYWYDLEADIIASAVRVAAPAPVPLQNVLATPLPGAFPFLLMGLAALGASASRRR